MFSVCLGSNQSSALSGQTAEEQRTMIERFNQGSVKVLVATSVAEEGLDISACNLIIKYNNTGSERSLIQRRGLFFSLPVVLFVFLRSLVHFLFPEISSVFTVVTVSFSCLLRPGLSCNCFVRMGLPFFYFHHNSVVALSRCFSTCVKKTC